MKIAESTVVITGATGGIGAALAMQLSKLGAKLLLVARNIDSLKALQHQLHTDTGRVHDYISADITSKQGKIDVIYKARMSQANMLINAAGISDFSRFESVTERSLNATMNINLLAPMMLSQMFLSECSDDHASEKCIVNIGSALGSIGFPCYSSYCASKFGLRGFSESLQRELSNTKHKVFYFAPRATATKINSEAANEMNFALGNAVDTPEAVAKALVKQIVKEKPRVTVGWPERLFVRINGVMPELVDSALRKNLEKIKRFAGLSPKKNYRFYEEGVDEFINHYFD